MGGRGVVCSVKRGGVLGEECEDGGREITAAVETNYTDL